MSAGFVFPGVVRERCIPPGWTIWKGDAQRHLLGLWNIVRPCTPEEMMEETTGGTAEDGVGTNPWGVTGDEAAAMLRAVFNLFSRWELDDAGARRLLGDPPPGMFEQWKARGANSIPADTVGRLADILGIHRALRSMFTDPERGYAWVRRPNAAFAGRSALDRMLEGAPADLQAVRSYLETELAGHS